MLALDFKTVLFSYVAAVLVCTFAMTVLWHQNRQRFGGMIFWVLDYVFQTSAVLMLILRGSLSVWISIILANALVIAGAILGYMALESFAGRKHRQTHNFIFLGIFVCLHAYYTFVQPNLAVRSLNVSAALLIVSFQCMWFLLCGVDPETRRYSFGVAMTFGGYCIINLVRVIAFFIRGEQGNAFLQSGVFEIYVFTGYQILTILITFNLALMFNRRLILEIEAQEDKFSKAFYSSPYAMLITDFQDGKIIDANETFLTIFGFRLEEILGKRFDALGLWEQETNSTDNFHELLKGGSIQKREFRFRKKSGEVMTIFFSSETIFIDNQKCILASIDDITARKRAELAMRQTQAELEQMVETRTKEWVKANEALQESERQLQHVRKMEAIGTLAGGIAHDFNNMLGVITGNISHALAGIDQKSEMFEVLADAQKGALQAQGLTQQLLTFAKGGQPIRRSADLNLLIKESARFVTRGANSKCVFKLDDNLWPGKIDIGQLHQAIGNIIINASQAMPEGGQIEICTNKQRIEDQSAVPLAPGRYIHIQIKDQGIGIPEKHLPKIFDPFFTTKQKGSGLGLATTFSIIQKHDGHITVESEQGVGTTFHIYLPAAEQSALAPETPEAPFYQGRGTILIMDDQEPILKMAARMLERMGYAVAAATDGSQAIAMYRKAFSARRPFDLVILDLTVPGGLGGAKTIQELLKIDPHVKAVVSSGYSNDPIMANYKAYGFCGVIPKPYARDQLTALVKNLLGQKVIADEDLLIL